MDEHFTRSGSGGLLVRYGSADQEADFDPATITGNWAAFREVLYPYWTPP